MNSLPLVSIVIPLFNEDGSFPFLRKRLESLIRDFSGKARVEIVLVDDGSRDGTWEKIQAFAEECNEVAGISLSRNFGHQRALFCGYEAARGDAIISMDGDLQDPPEIMHEMVAQWMKGMDVVFAVRKNRHGETAFKKITAHVFYRLLSFVGEIKAPLDTGDFRLLSRRALDAMLRMKDSQKYLRGMVGWLGFNSTKIYYDRPERVAGETKFNLKKMVTFAVDGVLSFSRLPLRLAFLWSLIAMLPFLAYLIVVLIRHFIGSTALVPGWASLLLCIIVFGSLNLLAVGILGEYIGRIFEATQQRPHYIIKDQTQASGNITEQVRR
jgi:dolichol-phosphate mannosyltransferase